MKNRKNSNCFKVRTIDIFTLKIPFLRPHKISLGTAEGRKVLIVRITADNGISGIGEAIAHPAFSGEALETLKGGVRFLEQYVLGQNPLNINQINALMDKAIYGNFGAKCAIETALFDLAGKYLGVPVYDLLGGSIKDKLPLSRSASSSDLEKDISEVKGYLTEGYRIIKVKVGILNVQQDVERVKAIREMVGWDVSLRADANQGWDVPTALKFIKGIEECSLEFLEQPVAKADLDGLAYLRSKAPVPLMADEAATTEQDILKIIGKKAADFVSIKLIKSGGIMRARRMAHLAETAGIRCYLGSQGETSVGTSASLHYALSVPGFDYGAEIYGPKFFLKDIVKSPVNIENGYIYPSQKPGFGVELDMDRVKEFSLKN